MSEILTVSDKCVDRPWAVITSAGMGGIEVLTEDGEIIRADRGNDSVWAIQDLVCNHDFSVYLAAWHNDLVRALGGRCTGHTWHRPGWGVRVTRIDIDAAKIYMLPDIAWGMSLPEAFKNMALFAHWVRANGAGMTSLGSITKNLLRANISNDIVGEAPKHLAARDAICGGRKETRFRGELRNVEYVDMTAAYVRALANLDLPLRFEAQDRRSELEGQGFAIAKVVIPESRWNPLPLRMEHDYVLWGYCHEPVRGTWTFEDLRMAIDAGCKVRVLKAMKGTDILEGPFRRWGKVIESGRNIEITKLVQGRNLLDGKQVVSALAKHVGNRAWGSFSVSGKTGVRRWDEYGNVLSNKSGPSREYGSPHVAALVDSSVRNKVWREVLSPYGEYIYYWDTDGGVSSGDFDPPEGWKIKRRLEKVQISGVQAYRYKKRFDQLWTVSVAGMDPSKAMRMFETGNWTTMTPSFGNVYGGEELCVDVLLKTRADFRKELERRRSENRT